jgi:hypothetical protein
MTILDELDRRLSLAVAGPGNIVEAVSGRSTRR